MVRADQVDGLRISLEDSVGLIKAWDEFLNVCLFIMQEKDARLSDNLSKANKCRLSFRLPNILYENKKYPLCGYNMS